MIVGIGQQAQRQDYQVQFERRDFRKSKKINKSSDRNREQKKKSVELTKIQKIAYARALAKAILDEFSVGSSFFEYLAQEFERTPRQIQAFHRRMLSEFRTKKGIVRFLLMGGGEMSSYFQFNDNSLAEGKRTDANSRRRGSEAVSKAGRSFDTDSSLLRFQSADLELLQSFVFAENDPDSSEDVEASFFEILDLDQDFYASELPSGQDDNSH